MDAAASMIEKAIIANPTYAEAYNNLGNEQPTKPSETFKLCHVWFRFPAKNHLVIIYDFLPAFLVILYLFFQLQNTR